MIQSPSGLLLSERRGHSLLLTINNPPANTWNKENLGALKSVVEQSNQDREVYAIVITGQGRSSSPPGLTSTFSPMATRAWRGRWRKASAPPLRRWPTFAASPSPP